MLEKRRVPPAVTERQRARGKEVHLLTREQALAQLTAPGQLKNTAAVTLNGGAALNLWGNNALGSLSFNNSGATGAAGVNLNFVI